MTTTTAVVTIHVLLLGYPACKFSGLQPLYWPAGNISIRRSELANTRRAIDDPDSELCSVLLYEICPGCDRALRDPSQLTADVPIVVAAHRRCARCGLPLTPWWPAIYCSKSCGIGDERAQ